MRFPQCSEKLLENDGENMSVFVCCVWESVTDVCCLVLITPPTSSEQHAEKERVRLRHQTFMRL